MMLRHYILTLILLLFALPTTAQNKKIAQQKEVVKRLERSIAEEEKRLVELEKNKASKEEQVASLATQIETRRVLIRETSQQIKNLTQEVEESEARIHTLEGHLLELEENMRKIVRSAYRDYCNQDKLTYLLSSKSFSEVTSRVAMLRAATEYRKKQVEQILSMRQDVKQKRDSLTMNRNELAATKKSLDSQRKDLEVKVSSAKKTISQMSKEQKAVLESKEKNLEKLSTAKKELKRLQDLAKNNKTGNTFSAKTKDLKLPVSGGTLKRHKGNMAEIVGKEGASVTSVYEGKVLDIKQNKMTNYYEVYIAHGKYISSYANLSEVSVTKNSTVKKGQRIGTIGSAINLSTMETEYKLVFGIHSPNPNETMSAANCFKK